MHAGYVLFILIITVLSVCAWYITRTEKRSFRSWVSERMLQFRLKKGLFGIADDPDAFLAAQAVANERPYVFPTPLKLLGVIEQKTICGMDCVVLSERDHVSKRRILYLHGGAYVEQPILPHWLFLDKINNQCKAVVTVPLYPKAPVHTFAQTFGPMLELYRDLLGANNPKDIVVMGDSAGGGLALACVQQILFAGLPQPKAVILISPWLDITLHNEDIAPLESKDPMLVRKHLQAMGRAWVGDGNPSDCRVSPINGPVVGLAPISLFVGTHELFLADARKFRTLCIRRGVSIDYHEYPKMNHDFPLFPISEARKAQKEILRVIG